jgi:hypothetical protein
MSWPPFWVGAALTVRHRAPDAMLLLWCVWFPVAVLLGGRPKPSSLLQEGVGLTLTLLELGRLAPEASAEWSITACVLLFLLIPAGVELSGLMRVEGHGGLVSGLAAACLIASSGAPPRHPDVWRAALSIDLCAAYLFGGARRGAWPLLLPIAPFMASALGANGHLPVARWGLLPAFVLSGYALARPLCLRTLREEWSPQQQRGGLWTLFALAASCALGLCASADDTLEWTLLGLHAGARWLPRVFLLVVLPSAPAFAASPAAVSAPLLRTRSLFKDRRPGASTTTTNSAFAWPLGVPVYSSLQRA